MNNVLFRITILIIIAMTALPAFSEGLRFAIIPHSTSDINFIEALKGAQDAAKKNNDTIFFLGEEGAGHVRYQDNAILRALELKVDGIGLAPMKADYLINRSLQKVIDKKLPLVLFESDFPEQYQSLRAGYVGTNGVELGRELAEMVKKFKPDGGVIALMANNKGHESIAQRIKGIRQVLSGDDHFEGRLMGEGGWFEHERTPWYCNDRYGQALNQLLITLNEQQTDVFVSAGWWPQMAPAYQEEIRPFKAKLDNREIIILSGDAAPVQLEHLEAGLSHGNVSQDFYSMGKHIYQYLKALHQGESIPSITYTRNMKHSAEAAVAK